MHDARSFPRLVSSTAVVMNWRHGYIQACYGMLSYIIYRVISVFVSCHASSHQSPTHGAWWWQTWWWCMMMIHDDDTWWWCIMMMRHDDASWWCTIHHDDDAPWWWFMMTTIQDDFLGSVSNLVASCAESSFSHSWVLALTNAPILATCWAWIGLNDVWSMMHDVYCMIYDGLDMCIGFSHMFSLEGLEPFLKGCSLLLNRDLSSYIMHHTSKTALCHSIVTSQDIHVSSSSSSSLLINRDLAVRAYCSELRGYMHTPLRAFPASAFIFRLLSRQIDYAATIRILWQHRM